MPFFIWNSQLFQVETVGWFKVLLDNSDVLGIQELNWWVWSELFQMYYAILYFVKSWWICVMICMLFIRSFHSSVSFVVAQQSTPFIPNNYILPQKCRTQKTYWVWATATCGCANCKVKVDTMRVESKPSFGCLISIIIWWLVSTRNDVTDALNLTVVSKCVSWMK